MQRHQQFFEEQNLFGRWIAECCEIGPEKSDTHAKIYKSWKTWAEGNGEVPGSGKSFTARMKKAGYASTEHTPGDHNKRGFIGICIKPIDTSNQWQNRNDD